MAPPRTTSTPSEVAFTGRRSPRAARWQAYAPGYGLEEVGPPVPDAAAEPVR
jgi:hypothetical protein